MTTTRRQFGLGVLATGAALRAGTQAASAAPGDSPDQRMVVAYDGGAVTLDPIMRSESTSYAWQRHIFDTLTLQDRQGLPQPRIATAWKSTAPDTWRLTVRSEVTFHDGTIMTADDVGSSIIDAATNPKSQSHYYVPHVTGYKVVDDHTVDVAFGEPDPLFPLHVANIPVMPMKLIKRAGREAFGTHPVGTGPYKFAGWLADDHLDLDAWDGFWGTKPAFAHVRLQSIPDAATRLASLLSGQIQVAEKIGPPDFLRVKNSGRAYITVLPGTRTIYLAVDTWRKTGSAGMPPGQVNPFLDPRVRQAVYLGINVPLIRDKIFNGAATVASQFMPPGLESYEPELKRLPYDPGAAKKLLAEAGYPNGFSVRLDAPNDRYLLDSLVAQAIGGLLEPIGIKVQVNAIPKAVFFPNIDKGDFTMYLAGWGNTDPLSTYMALLHCRDLPHGLGHVNRGHFCDEAADKTMQTAASTFDDAARVTLEREAYAIVERQDFALIPLYYEDVIAGVQDGIVWTSRPDELILAWEMTRKA